MRLLSNVFIAALFVITSVFAQENKKTTDQTTDKKVDKTLTVGMKAPDFTLEDPAGNKYTLSSFKGKSPVVVYFYPKAGTTGCTIQACGIRDDWSKFKKSNIQVLGISVDTKEEINQFISDYKLNFPLLSDHNKTVSQKYGVLKDNGMDKRVTYIIDKDGKIADVIAVDDVAGHAAKVYDLAAKLN